MNFFNVRQKKKKKKPKLCSFGHLTVGHLMDINGKVEWNKVNS